MLRCGQRQDGIRDAQFEVDGQDQHHHQSKRIPAYHLVQDTPLQYLCTLYST